MRMTVRAAAFAICGLFAFAGAAEARDRAPSQSVLARVRAGDFAQNCTRVAASGDTAAARSDDGLGLIDTAAGAPPVARQGIRVLPSATTTTYLRQLLQRFEAVQPPPQGIAPTVWIQDSPEVDARQRGSGDIYITRGALDALTDPSRGVSDEQVAADVAFILAHEYSHVLMCHYNRVMQTQSLSSTLETLGSVVTAASYVRQLRGQQQADGTYKFGLADEGRFRNDAASTMATQATLQQLNSGLLNPHWGREQERDADWLAVELMSAAGMSTDYVPELLSNLHSAETTYFSSADSVMQQLPQQLVSDLVSAQTSGQQLDAGSMMRSLAQRTVRQLAQGWLLRDRGHFHDNPDDRAERVALMLDFLGPHDSSSFAGWAGPVTVRFRTAAAQEFAGPRRAFEADKLLAQNNVDGGCAAAAQGLAAAPNNPLVLVAAANCAVARNDAAHAAQNFQRLTQTPYAIPADFVSGSQIWAAARNRASAQRVLDAGAGRFGAESFFVPRMLMLAAFSDTAGVNSVRDQCLAGTQSQKLKTECSQTAAQITGQAATAQTPQTPVPGAPAVTQSLQDATKAIGGLFGSH
jgi:Peptidase family M48